MSVDGAMFPNQAYHGPSPESGSSPIPNYHHPVSAGLPGLSPVSAFSSSSSNSYDSSEDAEYQGIIGLDTGAGMKALSLLNEAVLGDGQLREKPAGAISAREAAILRYKSLPKQERAALKAKWKGDKEFNSSNSDHSPTTRAEPRIVPRKRMEVMATSTRAPKPLTPEDVRDPETVAGMKCQLDIDREDEARKKALRLLNEGFIF